jgi:hypothetical protein
MPIIKETGLWEPELTEKQREAYYMNKKFMLLSGPRLSGKTFATVHRVIRHAWEVGNEIAGARVAVFCTTIKNGLNGVWDDLHKMLKLWEADQIVGEDDQLFRVFGNPQTSRGSTRQHYMQIRNKWGAVAEFQLHSLEFEGDIESKFLGSRYSCIYFSELQNFHEYSTFKVSALQLRAIGIQEEDHLWIADTNPPDEGQEHWAYKMWFVDRVADEPPDYVKEDPKEYNSWKSHQASIGLVEFTIDDNPLAPPALIAQLKESYKDDNEGWDRFVLGKWVRGIGFQGAWFARDFKQKRSQIVIGEAIGDDQSEWSVMLPEPSSASLFVGLDTGETNHAAAIIQKRFVNGVSHWDILNEVVSIKQEVLLEVFAEELLSKMQMYEKILGKQPDWLAWGDTSLDRFRSNSVEGTDATVVMNATENRFFIQFAHDAKKPKTVRRRLTLIKNLITQGRIFVSANCFKTIEMFEKLRKGNTEFQYIMKGDPNKHVFDAISYVIFSEMLQDNELQEVSKPDAAKVSMPPVVTSLL